eukprot:6178179-Pleurochrysis_carterae.AAC.2
MPGSRSEASRKDIVEITRILLPSIKCEEVDFYQKEQSAENFPARRDRRVCLTRSIPLGKVHEGYDAKKWRACE